MIPFACVLLLMGTLLSMFYVGLEIAIVSVNRIRLQHLLRQKTRGALLVAEVVSKQETYLATSLIGVNVSNNFVVVVATYLARQVGILEYDLLKVVTFFLGSILFLFWVELLPKNLIKSCPTMFLLYMARPILWSRRIFSPFLILVDMISKKYSKNSFAPKYLNRHELQTLLTSYEGKEILSRPGSDMAQKLFMFYEVTMRQIMMPRKQVVAVLEDTGIPELLQKCRSSGFSRIPVFQEPGGPFIGIVNVFDLLYMENPSGTVKQYIREIPIVEIDELAYKVLAKFQNVPHRMAFVADKTGLHVGIVTVEDLIEEILGEIYDEFD